MSTQPPEPQPDEYAELVSHVNFEIEIIALSLDRVLPAFEREPDLTYAEQMELAANGNALLTSLRSIIWFFANNPGSAKFKNGVIARSFEPRWPSRYRGTELYELKACVPAISRRVSHLTVDRYRDDSPIAVSYPQIEDRLNAVLAQFNDRLASTDWYGKFHASLDDARDFLRTAGRNGTVV
jgi:hypothetical protein